MTPLNTDRNNRETYSINKIEKLKKQGILRERMFIENGELYVKRIHNSKDADY